MLLREARNKEREQGLDCIFLTRLILAAVKVVRDISLFLVIIESEKAL